MDEPSPVPALTRGSVPGDFLRGASLPFRAVGLIPRSPRLAVWAAVCAVVTLVALVGVVFGAYHLTGYLVDWLWTRPENGFGQAGWYALWAVAFVLVLIIGGHSVPTLLLSVLQDPLSEATEAALGTYQSPPFSFGGLLHGTFVSVWHTVARMGILLAGHALLLPLNLLPGVGSLLWTVLATPWTFGWLAAEYLDAPMARHLYPFSEVRRTVFRRLPLCLGFGAALSLLLWIPVLNLFLVPLAVVGGTLLFRGLREAGDLPPSA